MPQVKDFRIGKNGQIYHYHTTVPGGQETDVNPVERIMPVSVTVGPNIGFILMETGELLLLENDGKLLLESN